MNNTPSAPHESKARAKTESTVTFNVFDVETARRFINPILYAVNSEDAQPVIFGDADTGIYAAVISAKEYVRYRSLLDAAEHTETEVIETLRDRISRPDELLNVDDFVASFEDPSLRALLAEALLDPQEEP